MQKLFARTEDWKVFLGEAAVGNATLLQNATLPFHEVLMLRLEQLLPSLFPQKKNLLCQKIRIP